MIFHSRQFSHGVVFLTILTIMMCAHLTVDYTTLIQGGVPLNGEYIYDSDTRWNTFDCGLYDSDTSWTTFDLGLYDSDSDTRWTAL